MCWAPRRVCVGAVLVWCWLLASAAANTATCNRQPYNTQAEKVPGDNGYKIKISGNPEKYVPGEVYTGELVIIKYTGE